MNELEKIFHLPETKGTCVPLFNNCFGVDILGDAKIEIGLFKEKNEIFSLNLFCAGKRILEEVVSPDNFFTKRFSTSPVESRFTKDPIPLELEFIFSVSSKGNVLVVICNDEIVQRLPVKEYSNTSDGIKIGDIVFYGNEKMFVEASDEEVKDDDCLTGYYLLPYRFKEDKQAYNALLKSPDYDKVGHWIAEDELEQLCDGEYIVR